MNQSLLEKLLAYYNLSYEDYLLLNKECSLSDFDNGHHFLKIEEASEMVKESISKKEKIVIYGDYDADGIMGTSILVKMFHYLDYNVGYYVPSRYIDGYGITLTRAQEFIEKGYKLVITVDNGITAFEPIALLREHNVKVLVLDHHTPAENLPNANYIIHPLVSKFGDTASSGAFTAFMFSRELLGYSDKYLSTLAAISLISDMMPLKEYNRYLLKTVFKNYIKGEFLPIDLLADNEGFDENIIASKIAPRINSIGRIIEDNSINKLIPYFLNEDKNYILNYFSQINETNETRKLLTKSVSEGIEIDTSKNAIIIRIDAKEGLIGLIANYLLNIYKKPVIVFAKSSEEGLLKGSARSIDGFNVVEAFNKLNKYLVAFGGHALAGGCSLKEDDFEAFYTDFNALVTECTFKANIEKSITVSINDISKDSYELIKSFSPFGEEFQSPILLLKNVKVASLRYSKTNEHIFTNIGLGKRIVGFNLSSEFMKQYNFVDLYGSLKCSSFNGYTNIDFTIKNIVPLN